MPPDYERDEFDEAVHHDGPVGVHRAPRPWWSTLVPILITFLLGGAVAYGLATYFWNQDPATPVSPTPSVTAPSTPEPTPTPTPSIEISPTPTETTPPEPVINFDADIDVLNASGIGGLAGRNQGELADAGFTNATAGDLSSGEPSTNTVFYATEDLADTAQRVAEVLGIDTVQQGTPPGGGTLEAVLVTDPDA